MRKLWYAGAVAASGFLLFAAAPAQASEQPGEFLFSQLPLLGGVLPNGHQQSFNSLTRPTPGDPESTPSIRDGVPLLSGLGGAQPVTGLPTGPGGDAPDVTGLPGGGMAVLAPAVASAADSAPAPTSSKHHHKPAPTPAPSKHRVKPTPTAPTSGTHKHKVKPSARLTTTPSARSADPRLHEEPIDGDAARTFSPNGRPVAGVDQQYQ